MIKTQYIVALFLLLSYCSSIKLTEQSNFKEHLKSTVINIRVSDVYYSGGVSMRTVGRNGALVFSTDYTGKEDDVNLFNLLDNYTIAFQVNIKDGNEKEYPINCRFEKFTDEPLLVFCGLDEKITEGNYLISFNESFFSEFEFYVYSTVSFDFFKDDAHMPNLYSDVQNIIVKENIDTIEIKFNIIAYKNEKLLIVNDNQVNAPLDDCQVMDNKLICKYQREKLLEIMSSSQDNFYLSCIDDIYSDANKFYLVKNINIIYNIIEKEDIFVGITKPLEANINIKKFLVYETNITNITSIRIGFSSFKMNFENMKYIDCGFSKYENILYY